MLCNVMLLKSALQGTLRHNTQLVREINVTVHSMTLARTIWLPDDGPRTEICRSVCNVLMYKFYICAVVGIIIDYLEFIRGENNTRKRRRNYNFL